VRLTIVSLCLALALNSVAYTQTSPAPQQQATASRTPADAWWKHAVIYEVYPRSFQDSNGDGKGDIKGIESRLGYLKSLGIDAIWITPMYPSPQVDFGYDIADYEAIDPQYGTMSDFDQLLKSAKAQGIRVIMDIVLNHTSDQHPWFKESRSSRNNPKRDWYVWHDGTPPRADKPGNYPNNWQSWFGHSAWTLDPKTNQYYYHYFYTQQPDLNWRNPQVRKAMYDVMKFWLDKGVSGFRMDAVSRLFEDPNLHDDPYLPGTNAFGDRNIKHLYTDDLPEGHEVFRELRKLVDSYPSKPVLIAEADEPTIADLSKMYGAHGDEVQLPMDFQIADVNELSAPKFRKLFDEVETNPADGWPEWFFSNHDQVRQWERYSALAKTDAERLQIAKLLAVLELTPRGTPQMYYGEEIGMRTTEPKRKEDVRDPIGITGWPKEKGRDGERTPMQWTAAAPNAGFTTPTASPWLPVPPSAHSVNVETESKLPASLLNFYKSLLHLRHTEAALLFGDYVGLNPNDQHVFSFLRRIPTAQGHSLIVALNMSNEKQTVSLDLSSQKISSKAGRVLQSNYSAVNSEVSLEKIELPPFGATIIAVE
jgi:alpha-glucosidase